VFRNIFPNTERIPKATRSGFATTNAQKQSTINTTAALYRRDVHWAGSGLWRILLILDWSRSIKCFINLGPGQGRRQLGGQWCPAPHFKSVPPHFTFGSPVAAYIQYCILKMRPPFWFLAPLLLNPGDGPGQDRIWTELLWGICLARMPIRDWWRSAG